MMLAARSGDRAEVQRLLDDGKKVNELSRSGWTALMFAASKGHLVAAKTLLDAGADPNIESEFIYFSFMSTGGNYPKSTALQEAIRGRHFKIAQLLMDRGATVDEGALRLAGQFGDPSFLSSLQRRGVSFRSAEVHTPVMLAACEHCNLEAVRWLLQNGASPNAKSERGTALEAAVRGDCSEVVRYLLGRGADPNLVFGSSGDESTALYVAVQKHTGTVNFEKNLAVVSSLLSHGAERSFSSKGNPRTPRQLAEARRDHTRQLLADPKTRETMRKQLTERLVYEDKLVRLLMR